jgi:hypothetical protein
LIAGVAGAANPASFPDPAGDAGKYPRTDTAPDIGTFNYQPVAAAPPPNLGPD